MHKVIDKVFHILVVALTIAVVVVLVFVIYFIAHEALPLFDKVSLLEFLFGSRWMPVDYTGNVAFGIKNFIAATIMVSFFAMVFSVVIGLGAAVWLSCVASQRVRNILYPVTDLLAGVPSVIMGFTGLTVLVKIMMKAGVHTGTCVLAAVIVLAVMLLPFLMSSCSDTILKVKNKYLEQAEAMGVSKWYAITSIILPSCIKNIFLVMILAIGRAMGETMAVMMVIGNTNLAPTLLGKSETIASVIALEMGTAANGSTHYNALYAAGLVLLIILLVINIVIQCLHDRLADKEVL